ncbi:MULTISPECIES: hypothetical protein [Nonomuraea]|uniref:Uncharacterized protein n=1 Tax=Nonomuraea ferruginea TaxID=46174 RepID=A0ABT4T517_9ACTN|nr:hypothetical protein [Nonomuraea ferruginea]MDA0644504.1 hypothetical protein [Nonomuraea ferruginea]
MPTVREPRAEAYTKATFVMTGSRALRRFDPSARVSGQMTAEDTVRWTIECP